MQEYIDFFSSEPILSVAWVAIAAMLVQSLLKSKISGVKSVAAQDAIMMINKQNAIIVDVRSADEFKKGHIVNAKNIPVSQIDKGGFTEIEKRRHPDDRRFRNQHGTRRLHERGCPQVDARPDGHRHRLREEETLRSTAPLAPRRLERQIS